MRARLFTSMLLIVLILVFALAPAFASAAAAPSRGYDRSDGLLGLAVFFWILLVGPFLLVGVLNLLMILIDAIALGICAIDTLFRRIRSATARTGPIGS
jgi:hypothetical protein